MEAILCHAAACSPPSCSGGSSCSFPFLPRPLLRPGPWVTASPPEPFNGLQITYTISGAELGAPQDRSGFTYSRTINGRLTGSRLIVSGVA